jgi:hypothetical protein
MAGMHWHELRAAGVKLLPGGAATLRYLYLAHYIYFSAYYIDRR